MSGPALARDSLARARSNPTCGRLIRDGPMLAPETITALVAGAVGIVMAIIAVLALDRLWPPVLQREFTVDLPLEKAWQHLARVEQWPSWAKHIKRVELQPAGELGLKSTGQMLLTNGLKPAWA